MFPQGQATEKAKNRKVTHVPERAAARRLTRVLPEENNASHCPKLRIVALNVTNFQAGLDQHVTGMEQRKGTLVLCAASWYTERTVLSGQKRPESGQS